MTLELPRGRLRRSRVVDDVGRALAAAFDCRLSGYAVLEPQDTLLLAADARGVLTFEDGVPVLAYHTGSDRGGPPALGDLAVPGPYRFDLVSLPSATLADLHGATELAVPPGLPAERLAGDDDLAARTRARAPADRVADARDADDPESSDASANEGPGAVEAFLENEEKIEAIREQAREEARARASEWGLDDFDP